MNSHPNIIYLENWYGQPIHCPFCGAPHDPEEGSAVVDCKHWLYTQFGDFLERSKRYHQMVGLPSGSVESDLFCSTEITERYGTAIEIVDRNRGRFINLVEYQIDTVSDITCIGFAPADEEMVQFGREVVSPYD